MVAVEAAAVGATTVLAARQVLAAAERGVEETIPRRQTVWLTPVVEVAAELIIAAARRAVALA